MTDITRYELATYATRAACAAGLAEGEATVLAAIVQDLLAAGTDCTEALLAALDALETGNSARAAARIADGAAMLRTIDGRPIAAATAACQVFDLVRSDGIREIRLGPVDDPVFIAGAVTSAARSSGTAATLADMAEDPAVSLVIRLHQQTGETSVNTDAARRVSLPEAVWDALQRRSARLYVPETERSRRVGAGADDAAATLITEMVGFDG